jgi:hypothetical protein
MNTNQIDNMLSSLYSTRNIYLGCFPCDGAPRPRKFPVCMVLNLDPLTQRGSHWIAVYAKQNKCAIYFDSLGLKPNQCLHKYLRANFSKIIMNNNRYQSFNSNLCGVYCIVCLHFLSIGYDYESFLKHLSSTKNTDNYIKKLYYEIKK